MSASSASNLDELTKSQLQCIDETCDRFEQAWRKGKSPRLEEYLERVPDSIQSVLLQELISIELPYRRRLGQTISAEEYTQRFPNLDVRIFRQINSRSVHSESGTGRGNFGSFADPHAAGLSILGDYRLIKEVGRGGMGIVYAAEQITLGRQVALKVLPTTHRLSSRHLQRFQNEARAAASLQHPNIVPVYAVGMDKGVHYYVMQLIDGKTLADIIEESSNPTEPTPLPVITSIDSKQSDPAILLRKPTAIPARMRTIAAHGIQAAEALEHAHSLGIVHRDIKPGNLMLDQSGKLWVTDFGLARIEADVTLTHSGDMLGTLRFMSPEQALAKHGLVDHRTDIYSLGATLYELIALRPAIDGKDKAEVLRKIAFEDPLALRKINSDIPRDLETIVLKAMAKEPRSRYQSAEELAEDLRRFLEDRPIRARRRTKLHDLARWTRRNRLLASAIATTIGVILVANVLGFWLWAKERVAHSVAANAQKIAMRQSEELERSVYLQRIALSEQEIWNSNSGRSEQILNRCNPSLRNWEWGYLKNVCNSSIVELSDGNAPLHSVAFSPDGMHVATGSKHGLIRIWDLRTSKYQELAGHTTTVQYLEFSPDGTKLASCAFVWSTKKTGEVKVWNLSDGSESVSIPAVNTFLGQVRFFPDGSRIAIASWGHKVLLYDLRDQSMREFVGHASPVKSVAVSPDGQTLASGDWKGNIKLWDVASGENQLVKFPTPAHRADVVSLEFNQSGNSLVSSSWDSTAILWDVATGAKKQSFAIDERSRPFSGGNNTMHAVKFVLKDSMLATGSEDGSVRIWDIESKKMQVASRGHQGSVNGLAVSPTRGTIASVGADGKLRLWCNLEKQTNHVLVTQLGATIPSQIGFRPDNEMIVVATKPPPVKGNIGYLSYIRPRSGELEYLKDPTTQKSEAGIPQEGGYRTFAFDQSSNLLYADHGNQVRSWDAGTREYRNDWSLHESQVTAIAAIADGLMVSGSEDGQIKIWNAETGRVLQAFEPGFGPIHMLVANATCWAAVGDNSNVFYSRRTPRGVWTAPTQIMELSQSGNENLDTPSATSPPLDNTDKPSVVMAIDPNRPQLATGNSQGVVRIWDIEKGYLIHFESGHAGQVTSISYSPDGQRIASGGDDGTVVLWDTVSGQEALVLRKQLRNVFVVAFSPKGDRLMAFESLGRGIVWNGGEKPSHANGLFQWHTAEARLAEINHQTDLAIAHLQGALRIEPNNESIIQWSARLSRPSLQKSDSSVN
jgi:eukaryotic-like serine/threonine-protein kinase